MSADIGAKIGIEGEKAFKDSLAAINSQIKTLGSEMKAVVSSFAGMEDSTEAVDAKTEVLGRSVAASAQKINILQAQAERAAKKLDALANELDAAKREFGENSAEALKAQNAYHRQVVAVNRLETQINQTRAEINRMEHEMKSTAKAADTLGDELQEAGREAEAAGTSFRDAFSGGLISGAVQSFARGVASLVEHTAEYRKIMGTLEISGQKAGYAAEEAAATYQQLYSVLGDAQQTATTTANLQAMRLEQDKLKQMTDGAIGAWATYGDSIPIDGLAEAINETVQVGKVTGTFADVLNWAGTNEDAFNDKLEAAGSQAARVNLILEEMANQGLQQAAAAWRENNAEIAAANAASAELEQVSGRLGALLSPLVTRLKEGLADVLNTVLDMLENGNPLIALVAGLAVALSGMGLAAAISQGGLFVGVLGKMTTGFQALNTVMKANPILLVVSLLAGLISALITAYQTNEDFRNKVDAAWSALKTGVGEKIEAVKGHIEALKTKCMDFIERLKNIPAEMKTLGGNIISGLWDGIDAKVQWVKNKAQGAVDGIKHIFTGTAGFDTHSPSKWAKKVAGWVMQGLGIGFAEDTTAVQAAQNATEDVKEVFADASEEIGKNAEEIAAAVDTMENKLADYGGLFETISDENGGSRILLSDMQKNVDAIRAYGDALQRLKEKDISSGLFEEILDMDVDAGRGYMDALLQMTDEDLSAYVALFEEKQRTASEIAQAFYGIGAAAAENLSEGMASVPEPDVAAATAKMAADAGISTQEENMEQVIAGMQAQYPLLEEYIASTKEQMIALIESYRRDFRTVGEDMMRGVAQGIRDGRSGVVNAVAEVIADAIKRAEKDLDINSPSGVFEEIGDLSIQGFVVGWKKKMRYASDTVSRGLHSLSAPRPQIAAAGSSIGGNQTYSYGDINVYVDKLNNANGRDAQTLAAELEFYRRQQEAGKGGTA